MKCPGRFFNKLTLGDSKLRQLKCLCKCAGQTGNPGNFICQHVTKVTDKSKLKKSDEWAKNVGFVTLDSKPHAKKD